MQRLRFFLTLVAALLVFDGTSSSAAEPAGKEAKPSFTAEQAAALETLKLELARLDPMLEKVDDLQHQAWVRAKMDLLKTRFADLQKSAFDQTKVDELRFDVNIEYQRLALWLRPLLTPPKPKGK